MNWNYVLHELGRRRHRSAVNVLGIAIGVALFVTINAVAAAFQRAAAAPFQALGADLIVQQPARETAQTAAQGGTSRVMRGIRPPFGNQYLGHEALERLRALPEVAELAPALLLWEFRPEGFRSILGVDFSRTHLGPVRVRDWISKGRFPADPGEVLVEKHFAKFHRLHPAGTAEGTGNIAYLRLHDPARLPQVEQQIPAALAGATVTSANATLQLMGGMAAVSDRFVLLASLLALAGAVALVLKSVQGNLLERAREIGILKAVGWTGRDVRRQLMGEILPQALLGGLLGLLLGYLAAVLLSQVQIALPLPWEASALPTLARETGAAGAEAARLPVRLPLPLVAAALGISLGCGLVAGYLAGRRCESLRPMDTLR